MQHLYSIDLNESNKQLNAKENQFNILQDKSADTLEVAKRDVIFERQKLGEQNKHLERNYNTLKLVTIFASIRTALY